MRQLLTPGEKTLYNYNHSALHGSTMDNISTSIEIKAPNIVMGVSCEDGGYR